ncbi:RidA family protein [Erysipelothrix sp. HDW6C]|uniref:RidA family protein n=1 Tax=Erysipelothrix sp. HDW6C TaxID=2714930 RepID=UPI00140E790C|nr:RidA family protein [Erysipelothrix sp. HDW6C]QIK69241.1 RidA family protein [Erysipelothrix sp. HDW6C]
MTLYRNSIAVQGELLFISGQTPQEDGITPLSFADQIDIVINKIAMILKSHNLDVHHLVNMNIYLTHRDDLPLLRERLSHFLRDTQPTMSLVIVAGLVDAQFKVEIDAVAQL